MIKIIDKVTKENRKMLASKMVKILYEWIHKDAGEYGDQNPMPILELLEVIDEYVKKL